MKKFLVIFVAFGLALGVTACGNSTDQKDGVSQEEITYTSDEIIAKITEGIELPAQMAMEGEMFNDTYGIDTNLLADYTVMMPMMSAHSNEIAVLKVKNQKDVAVVKEALTKRANAAEENTLYPEQKELIQAHQIVSEGNYILYVVDGNADQIVEGFHTMLQQ